MSVEQLKPLAEILRPDTRMTDFIVHDRATGKKEPYTIQEHYERYASLRIEAEVPEQVASGWTTAQYLAIYGFYAYPLIPLAVLQALTTLELALRLRTQKQNAKGLRELLKLADRTGLIDKTELLPRNRLPADSLLILPGAGPELDADQYWHVLLEALAGMRNIFAHGTHALYPDALVQMDIPRRIIRQIYSRAPNDLPATSR